MKTCPLCHTPASPSPIKHFFDCQVCRGRFRDPLCNLTPDNEKARYESHNNDVNDKRYQDFVSPITNAVLKDFTPDHKGLDFGAGPGPVIAKMLEDQNYQVAKYDPFFHNHPEVLKQTYDYIISCEVIEHFNNPAKEFKLLKSILNPDGKIYCMTHLLDDEVDFNNWYYKNDPTHVFFYREETVAWIKETFGFKDSWIEGRLIMFAS